MQRSHFTEHTPLEDDCSWFTFEAKAIRRARIAPLLAAVGIAATLAGATLYFHRGGTSSPAGGGGARPAASVPSNGPTPEPYDRDAARLRARAALQECLKKAEFSAKTSWDGMCASLALRNNEQRDSCRQQGRTAEDCQSAYAETPVKDCLLPHETASSIAQAQQSAKSDCYQQFQAEMR